MIIAHLIHDMRSLIACSRTCYSWYLAAVHHLHRPLIIGATDSNQKFMWPTPIKSIHKLGLLPLVTELRIYNAKGMSKNLFSSRVLRQFTAFVNVRDLRIGHLDIPSFIPHIQRYFGHFLPTVKSLSLAYPKGSHRQIIFFIGLFQHLEDLMLNDRSTRTPERQEDMDLAPHFVPPFGGRLVIWYFRRAGLVKDIIDSFGGIKFSSMNIFDVAETRLLLSACAKTLRILQLQPTDPHGERLDLLCMYHEILSQ